MSKRFFGLFGLALAGLVVFTACADPQQPTATPRVFSPTVAGQVAATSTPSGTTVQPQPTQAPSVPDAAEGQSAFAVNCVACHNTTDQQLVGPGLAGVAARAETRVPGQSADDYLRTSILNPNDFVVDGFAPIMPQLSQLTEQDVENLIAYLKTLQ